MIAESEMSSMDGGERGIRTLDGILSHTPLAGARLRPLGHLSLQRKMRRKDTRVIRQRKVKLETYRLLLPFATSGMCTIPVSFSFLIRS